jgi:hypothetical protein
LQDLETTPIIINFSSNIRKIRQLFLPSVLSQQVFLKQLINFKLVCKGFVPIHAAAVSKEKKAIVFPGRGGTFKTTLSMDFARNLGYKIFGDDWVIIDKNKVYCYLIHSRLFDYRVNKMKGEKYFILDKFKYLMYQKFRSYDPKYVVDNAEISSIFFIAKSDGKQIKAIKLAKNDVIAKAVNSYKIEFMSAPAFTGFSKGIYDYFAAYSYVFPDSKIARYWDIYELTLDDYLSYDTYYEIFLPRTYTKTTFRDFTELIGDIEEQKCKRVVTPSTI